MCKSNITPRKFIKLFLEIEIYKVIFYVLFFLTGYEPFSLKGLIKALLPVTGIETGFTSCYLIFYLFIPFLNILIQNMNEKVHLRLMLLCLFVYTVLGTLPKINVAMNYVSWFIVLYFIASYIRCYPKKIFVDKKFWKWAAVISIGISAISVVVCAWISRSLAFYFLSDSNKILAVITAVSVFMYFKNINLKYNKTINKFAGSVFGVLLIHANSDAMRRWLWKDILKNTVVYYTPWLVVHAIGSVMIVFLVCNLIDQFRIRFIEVPFLKLFDRYCEEIFSRIKNKEKVVLEALDIDVNS